nr:MAG TPA: HNH endonuclease [Caudoviricetes sp.]
MGEGAFIVEKHNTYVDCGEYYKGITKRYNEFYFDKEDYELVSKYYWVLDSSKNVITKIDGKNISMQKLLFGNGAYKHIDNNNSNNRRENIVPVKGFKNSGKTYLCGYIAVYMPEHKRAFKDNGSVYEHILVAEKMLGRELKDGECVHHIDGNRTNNSEDNLMVFSTNNDHIACHGGCEIIKQEDGAYKSKQKRFRYFYNNRTKEDIDNNIEDVGSITIIPSGYDICPICKKRLKPYKAKMCIECRNKETRKNIPSKKELEKNIYNIPFTKIGEMYGVTDNAVKKWCRGYGLPFRKKDMKK